MRIASIYKLKDRILVHADSRTTDGVWVAAAPFLSLPLDSNPDDIGDAIAKALASSADNIPHPTDWRAVAAPRLSAAGVRSERSFQADAAHVSVSLYRREYIVEPHRNGGTSGADKGFHAIPELRRLIGPDGTPATIGQAVIEALASCEARPNNSFKPTPLRGAA